MRRTIHASLTPIRAAISLFGMTVFGRLAPTDAIAAPTGMDGTIVSSATSSDWIAGIVVLMRDTFTNAVGDSNRARSETPYAGGYAQAA